MARILCKNTKCSLGSVLYSVQWGSDLFPLVTSVFIAGVLNSCRAYQLRMCKRCTFYVKTVCILQQTLKGKV